MEPTGDTQQRIRTFRFGRSRQVFRGSHPQLERPYVACLGGTETFGRFVAEPWPALIGQQLGVECVNFGTPDAAASFFLGDPVMLEAIADAAAVVIFAFDPRFGPNRLYRTFHRRCGRLQEPAPALRAMYPEVEFALGSMVRPLTRRLHQVDPVRFEAVAAELRTAWTARMGALLRAVPGRRFLVWTGEPAVAQPGSVPVTHAMVAALRPLLHGLIEIPPGEGTATPTDRPMGQRVRQSHLDPETHRRIAEAMLPLLQSALVAERGG